MLVFPLAGDDCLAVRRSISRQSFPLSIFAAGSLLLASAGASAQGSATAVDDEAAAVLAEAAATPRSGRRETVQLETIEVSGEKLGDSYGASRATTAGKIPLDVNKTPQAIIVVPRELIDDFQPVFLDDALRSVSGINQTNTFGNTADGITIRGFQPNAYFRNGVRTLSSRNLTPSTDYIEVLKGPSSLLYGNVEPGGLVNVVSKRPLFDDDFTRIQYQLSNRGGNRWSLDVGAPLAQSVAGGTLAYRLIVDRDGSDYWRNFGKYDNTFISPIVSYQNERLRVTAAYEFTDNNGPFDRGTVVVGDRIADIPQTRRMGEAFEKLDEQINLGELDVEYDLFPTTTLRLRAAYQDGESNDLQARPRRVTEDSEGNAVLVRRVDGTYGRYAETRYVSASVLQRLETGPLAHQVLFGVDQESSKGGRDGFVQGEDESVDEALDIFNPVYGTLDPREVVDIENGRFDDEGDTIGLYLQDVVSIGDAWTVLLGGRFESYDSRSVTEDVPGATVSDDSTFLPRGGVVFRALPWASLYVSYSESFQPNLFDPTNFAPGSPTRFDPEQGVSKEAGIKFQFSRFNMTAAVYDIAKDNVLQVEDFVPRLLDGAESRGFEIDAAGELTPSLSLMLAYAYADTDDGEGRMIRNVPQHTVGLTTAYRWLGGALKGASTGLTGQYVGKRDGGSNPSASPGGPEYFTMPQYMVVDVFAAYELPTQLAPLRFQLNLKNALDENYFASSGGSLRINPGQSRTLYATVSARF